MMNIHAFVNATWNQAATEPTSSIKKQLCVTIYIYINITPNIIHNYPSNAIMTADI